MNITWDVPASIDQTHGGMLDFNGNGIAGCTRCGYRGVGSKDDPRCPVCQGAIETDQLHEALPSSERAGTWNLPRRVAPNVPRNAPCPCGSNRKAKKCCHR